MNKDDTIKIIESSLISIMASFPIASSIATGWNEYKNFIQQKNIQNILEKLSSKLEKLEENLDKHYINSADFKSLILKTCFYGNEEIIEQKREAFGAFLANSCLTTNSKDFSKNAILETIARISEIDIYILDILSKNITEEQKLVLSGENEYPPNKIPMIYIADSHIINICNEYKRIEILNTLDYLNALGLIENDSSRDSNNIDSYIESYLNNKKYKELHDQLINPYQTKKEEKKNITYNERLKQIEEETSKSENKANYEKFYCISSLGISILRYIR